MVPQKSLNFSAQLYNVSIHNNPDKVEVSFCLTSLFCFLIVLIFLRNYDKVNYANTRLCTRQSSSVHVEDRHYCEYALLINHVDVYRLQTVHHFEINNLAIIQHILQGSAATV